MERMKKGSSRSRIAVLALVVASAFGLWQLAPVAPVQAGPPVDQAIELPPGAPASFADIIEAVQPAVVNISVSGTRMPQTAAPMPYPPSPFGDFEDFLRRFFDRQSDRDFGPGPTFQGMGSGFIIDPEGYVVTNNHVVDGATEMTVTLNDGTQYQAELQGVDPKTDLAVLKVESDEPLPYARFGDSDETRVGDWVIAIGNPFGLGGTATTGIVSARGRDIQAGPFDDFLQIDAPINRGNSGGPLFDLNGRVIGINTAIYSPNGGNVGIGFAIPSAMAQPVIEQLRTTGRVVRGWLGVTIQNVDEDIAEGLGMEEPKGALVASVTADSPAGKAGLKAGDVVVSIDGEEVEHLKELTRAVADIEPGETVSIEVWRDGKLATLEVEIGETPTARTAKAGGAEVEGDPGKRLGLALAEITPEARESYRLGSDLEGALVVRVEPASPADQKGLRPGDVVVMVGQTPVTSAEQAIEKVEEVKAAGRESVLLRVVRAGQERFVAVPFA